MDERHFDATKYLTKVSGRDYLEVKWRLVWLRTDYPEAKIHTELVHHVKTAAIFRAIVILPNGAEATGWGSEDSGDFADYLEKAETKAIGRALGALGFGTQFCDDHVFGAEHQRVVDAPVQRQPAPPQQGYPGETHDSRPEGVTEAQRKAIYAITRTLEWEKDDARDMLAQRYGKTSSVELSKSEAHDCIDFLKGLEAQHRAQVEQGTLT